MGKHVEKPQRERRPSRYAQKKADRASRKRPPFEFTEAKARPASLFVATEDEESEPTVVHAVVTKAALHEGYLFLMTPEGQHVYLNGTVLRRGYSGHDVSCGFRIMCKVEHRKKGLRAVEVVSVSPP